MKLCLISSNIRFENPADGDNSWPHRKTILAQTLLKHIPDIIATQEGRYGQLQDFSSLLADYEIIDHHRSWMKERMYPTFFLKKNAFEFISSEDLWLSETPQMAGSLSFGSTFPRLMTWIKLQPKNSATKLLVVNTHLDHIKPETRASQIKVLSNEIKRIIDPSFKLILMGDFNDSPESEVRKILLSEFPELQDSWKKFNVIEESSHHAFDGNCPTGNRIDWIMTDKSIKIDGCKLEKDAINGKYPSDHFPVVCTISL